MMRTVPVLLTLLTLTLVAPGATAQSANGADTTFESYGYGDTSLRGTYGTADLFFPLPAGTTATGARLSLRAEPSPLLTGHSTLTVQSGGVDATSVRLDGDVGAVNVLVTVPAERIGANGLALGLRGYLRLTEDDCEESDNPGQWVTISEGSTIEFDLERTEVTLADLPDLMTGPPAAGPVGMAVGDVDDITLGAAAQVAWQIGRWRAAAGAPAVITTDLDDLPDGAPVVGVGAAGTLPADVAGTVEAGDAAAVLAVGNDPAIRLVVTGTQPDGVMDAARLQTDPATVGALPVTVADLTGQQPAPAPDRSAPWTGDATTLAQLGREPLTVVGEGPRELFVPVERPAGWQVTHDVEVHLDLDASAALRTATSTVQLLVNGRDAGTRQLASTDGPQRHTFAVPAGLADRALDGRPLRTLDLQVRMVLDLPEEICGAPDPAAARVTLLPTTTLEVRHRPASTLELGRFPHPLTGDDADEAVAIVLPDQPDADTVEAALQVAAALGRWAGAGGVAPQVITVGDDVPAGTAGRIVVSQGASAQAAGEALPEQRPPDAGRVQATLALTDNLPGRLPTLLLAGEGEGLITAARALADGDTVQQLAGDVAVLQADAPVVLADGTSAQPPPELAPPDRPWFDRGDDYVVPAIVVGLALLAMLLLVIVLRWRPMARRGVIALDPDRPPGTLPDDVRAPGPTTAD